LGRPTITANVLQLQEVGDFGDENCLPPLNLIRSTKLHLPIVPPISCRCCYAVGFLFLSVVSLSFTAIWPSLDWWAFYCPVTTINTTVALFWL